MNKENTINKDKITKKDICDLLCQKEDKVIRIMKIDVEILNGYEFELSSSFSEKFIELIGPYKEILLDISEELYRCSNKELWNDLKNYGYANLTMIDVLIEANQLNNYIKLDVPCLRLHQSNATNRRKIEKLSVIVKKLEKACIELTKRLHLFIEKYMYELVEINNIDNYELISYFDGEELLYDSFVSVNNLPHYIEKFNVFKLIKDDDIVTKIEGKLKKDSVKLHKNRAIKVAFNYKDKIIKNLNYCSFLGLV